MGATGLMSAARFIGALRLRVFYEFKFKRGGTLHVYERSYPPSKSSAFRDIDPTHPKPATLKPARTQVVVIIKALFFGVLESL